MRSISFILLSVLTASMVVIPAFFVFFDNSDKISTKEMDKIELQLDPNQNVLVPIYRSQQKTVEVYPLEEYVRGVVAAEMPIDFELEALKAQAIAARTYIVKRIIDKDYSDVPDGAIVTDTTQHQVFLSDEELKRLWGINYNERINKLNQAVNETYGQVITYNDQPINALYFSTSNGYTENSEEYWQKEIPYLRSVASPWDTASPKYSSSALVSFSTFYETFNLSSSVASQNNSDWIKILELTTGNRVDKLKVGDKIYSGREIRELFKLNSSSFTFEINNEGVLFNTKGYGHGVGMSQYGANGMANEGKSAEEIITYYYAGVKITDIERWIKK